MALEQAGLSLIAENVNVYIGDIGKAEKANQGFYSSLDDGAQHAGGFQQVITGALRAVGAAVIDFGIQGAKAIGGFVKDSVGLAGDFQQGMLEFQSVAGKDVDASGLEKFHDLFLQLGKDLPVSTADVQQAAIEMVKGGIDPAIVAAGGLKQNIQFAAAAMKGDLAGAAEISAKILGGWSEVGATAAQQADFLTHSTDLLTKAANASSVDVKELSLGIFNAQGIARTAGVSFDDLTTVLAELAPRFASSSEAGTSVKNMIARLQPTTKKATAAMEDLGLITEEGSNKFYDAQGNFVGMSKASQLLQNAMKGLTKQQQAATLQMIFGNDAMGAAAGLAELGADGYDAMAAKMEKANGVAAAAALIQQSFNTKIDNAKGSIETLQIIIGEQLLPVLGQLLDDYITPGINTITAFAESIFKADDPLVALSNSINTILPGFNEFGAFVENLSAALANGDWGGAFDILAQGLSDLGDTIGPPLIEALNSAAQMAFDWIVQKAPAWLDQLEIWGEQLSEWVLPYVPVLLGALGDAVSQAWAWVQQQAPGWLDQLAAWGEQLGAWIAPYIPQAIDALSDLIDQAWAWVRDQAPGWLDQLQAWGESLIAWIAPMIPPMLAELGVLASGFLAWIGEQAAPLLTKFQAWGESFVAWVVPATIKFLVEWPKMFSSFLDWIGNQAGPLLAKFGTWAVSFVQWIAPMIPGFLLALGGVAAAILVFVAETAGILYDKIVNTWVPAILGWVGKEVLPKLPGIFESIGKVIADWSVKTRDWVNQQMLNLGKAMVDGIKKGFSDAWGSFTNWIHSKMMEIPASVRDALGIHSPSTEMIPIGQGLIQGIALGLMNAAPGLYGLIGQIANQLVINAGKKINDAIREQNAKITDGLESMVKDIQAKIGTFNISILTSGADLNRQKAANIAAMDELGAKAKSIAQQQLDDAARIALTLNDPEQQAAYFKARSDAILEMAKLQDTLNKQLSGQDRANLEQSIAQAQAQMESTTNDVERQSLQQLLNRQQATLSASTMTPSQIAALQQQIGLINAAQQQEGQAQTAGMAQGSASAELSRQIEELFTALQSVKDSPVFATDPTIQAMRRQLDQLTQPSAQPMAAGQFAQQGTAASYTNNRTINMPVYTNMSQGAIQQSGAILQATLP